MQILDWRECVRVQRRSPNGEIHNVGLVMLGDAGMAALRSLIDQCNNLTTGEEIGLQLPDYTAEPLPVQESLQIFIKVASGVSNRAMIAHPEQNKWVLSVILCEEAKNCLLQNLTEWINMTDQKKDEALSLTINERVRFSFPSNANLSFLKG